MKGLVICLFQLSFKTPITKISKALQILLKEIIDYCVTAKTRKVKSFQQWKRIHGAAASTTFVLVCCLSSGFVLTAQQREESV